MKRSVFFSRLAGLFALGFAGRGQQLPPAKVEFQALMNPPACPLCRTPVEAQPVTLVVAGDAGAVDGSTLAFPVLVCPKDGLMFCVQQQGTTP